MARVLIIDDDPLVASSIARAIRMQSGRRHETFTGTSFDEGRALLRSIEALEVFLVDLMLPLHSGHELFPFARLHHPEAGLVLISAAPDAKGCKAAREWGASVFVKEGLSEELLWIVEHERPPAGTPAALAERFAVAHGIKGKAALVLRAGVLGLPDAVAAEELDLTVSSYHTYWTRLYKRTGCNSRASAIAAVLRFGSSGGLAAVR